MKEGAICWRFIGVILDQEDGMIMPNREMVWIGLNTDLWNRVPYLMRLGWKVTVILSDKEVEMIEKEFGRRLNISITTIPKRNGGVGLILDNIFLARIIRRSKAKLVIVDYTHIFSAIAASIMSRSHKRCVLDLLAPPITHSLKHAQQAFLILILLAFGLTGNECFVLTNSVKELVEKYSMNLIDCRTIEPGVDNERFSSPKSKIERASLLIKDDAFVLVYHGVISRVRNLDFLVDIMKILRINEPDIILLFLGDGDDLSRLHKKVNDLGFQDRIKFTGRIPFSEIPRYIAIGDLELAPLPDKGTWSIPYKIMEAMAAEKPILASDVPVIREMNERSKCLILRKNDPLEWAETISVLRKSPEVLTLKGKAGKQYALREYSWEHSAEKLNEFLVEILLEGKQPNESGRDLGTTED